MEFVFSNEMLSCVYIANIWFGFNVTLLHAPIETVFVLFPILFPYKSESYYSYINIHHFISLFFTNTIP